MLDGEELGDTRVDKDLVIFRGLELSGVFCCRTPNETAKAAGTIESLLNL